METIVQTKLRPEHNVSKTAAVQEKQTVVQQPQPQQKGKEDEEEKKKSAAKLNRGEGVLPAIITTLLLVPLVLVISIGVFICWRRNSTYDINNQGHRKHYSHGQMSIQKDIHHWTASFSTRLTLHTLIPQAQSLRGGNKKWF